MVVYLTYGAPNKSTSVAIASSEEGDDVEMNSNLIIGANNIDNTNTIANNMSSIQGINDRNISFHVYSDRNSKEETLGMHNIQ